MSRPEELRLALETGRPVGALSGPRLWDLHADWWKATFTRGADPEYELEILPLLVSELAGSRRLLDLGCGEGQVARHLVLSGAVGEVVGLEPSAAQLAQAGGPTPRIAYLRGRGEELPFAAASFDAVVCCLVIEHADDVDAVLGEVARVLAPGGSFLLLVNHPMFQGTGSGFVDDQILGEHYWRVGPYLTEQVSWEDVDAGVALPFAHRPLSRYVNPLAARDLVLVRMEEPAPRPEFLAVSADPELEGAIPRLLAMRFEHRPRLASSSLRESGTGELGPDRIEPGRIEPGRIEPARIEPGGVDLGDVKSSEMVAGPGQVVRGSEDARVANVDASARLSVER